ncbi:riboflavin synthase [Lactobacillus delbrueckii subsp. bulgaricus]
MMPQTFAKTTFKNLQAGDQVNMECSVPVGGRFEGHIVSGHVDETVEVVDLKQNENALELRFFLTDRLKKQVVPQGSCWASTRKPIWLLF